MLMLVCAALSGCATKYALVGGAEDLITLPSGTVIENVQIAGIPNKQNVTTQKAGVWISLDGWNRLEQTKGAK